MGPPKLADTLQIPLEEAEQLFKEYALSFPKLNNWLASQAKFGKINGYIRLPAPHKGIRWFDDIKIAKELRKQESHDWKTILSIEGQAERNAMNSPIQGGGAVICKEALVATRELLKQYDGYMLAPIHDELNFEIVDSEVEEFAVKAAELMKQVGNKYVSKVQMEAEITITKMWQK